VTRVKQLALRGAILAAFFGAASATYQQIAEARDRRRFVPPGRLITIADGRRLHLFETAGDGPVVVIVPAAGGGVLEWLTLTREFAGEVRMCVYDRAGIGWSDPPRRGRRTIDGMAADLAALLEAAGITPPYILVGHSLGGVIARRFAARHPDRVCAMLLIDSSHEDQGHRLREASGWEGGTASFRRGLRQNARALGARRLAARAGLLRHLDTEIAREVPPDFVAAARADALSARHRRAALRELLILARPQGVPPDLGALPLTVLTSAEASQQLKGRPWRGRQVWERLQDELAGLSTDSRHVTARKAGHYIHVDEPDLVAQAVGDLVNRCREQRSY
jgi:pimeloyl-ACP methyl ester carboxylesterase